MVGPTLLFAPADRPERVLGAYTKADTVVIDLEDAVALASRAAARAALVEIAPRLDAGRTVVRVNASGTTDLEADLAAVQASALPRVMLAKAESADQVAALAPFEVIALVETPAGVLDCAAIARAANCVGLMWGSEDLALSLGATGSRSGGALAGAMPLARQLVLLAARAAGIVAIDAVHPDLVDDDALRAEAADAAFAGYDAKACVHPRQVDIVREAFRPTAEQLEWARAVVAASINSTGAFSLDGQMVDAPVIRRAEALLRRS